MRSRLAADATPLRAQVRSRLLAYWILVPALVLFGAICTFVPGFTSSGNLASVLNQWAPLAIVAAGVTVVLIAGDFDLSTGGVFAASGVAAAAITNDVGVIAGLFAALLVGIVVGCVNAAIVSYVRVHSFLATLATGLACPALAYIATNAPDVTSKDHAFGQLGNETVLGLRYSVYVALVVFAILGAAMTRSVWGRHIFAVGGHVDSARVVGIAVRRTKFLAFMTSGCCAGLAGFLAAALQSAGLTASAGDTATVALTAAVLGGTSILGGRGALWRTVIGICILALIQNGFDLSNVNPVAEQMVTGGVLLAVLAVSAAADKA